MWRQVIMLLLGGFTIAAALSKHAIAKSLASWALSRVGQQPANVLLANMLTASFASMWISNVAAPVLCFSLVEPILRTLDANHSFAKSLVIGAACPCPHPYAGPDISFGYCSCMPAAEWHLVARHEAPLSSSCAFIYLRSMCTSWLPVTDGQSRAINRCACFQALRWPATLGA